MINKPKPVASISAGLLDIQYGDRTHRHWHYIYKKRRKKAATISSRQILVGQIIALTGALIAGYILEINKEQIIMFAGALLLLPVLVELSASVTGVMCAKINHRLEADPRASRVLVSNIGFSMLLTLFSGLFVGLIAAFVGELFFDAVFWKILVLCVVSLTVVGLVTFPLMSVATVLIKKAGFDPDNIIGAVETGFSDALMVLTIAIMVRVLL